MCGQEVCIAGVLAAEAGEKVSVYRVVDGELQFYDSAQVGEAGKFEFKMVIQDEGFYTIGWNEKRQHALYLKPGDRVNVKISDWFLQLKGRNSRENRTLYDWEGVVRKVRRESFFYDRLPKSDRGVYQDFFPLLENAAGRMQSCIEAVNTGNTKFDRLMKMKILYDMDLYALHYLEVPRVKSPKNSELSSYYRTVVSKEKYMDNDILELPWGRWTMIEYIRFALLRDPSLDFSPEKAFSLVGTDELRGEYLLDYAERYYASYDEFERMSERFGRFFNSGTRRERWDALREQFVYSKPGTSAPDIVCTDRDGKRVALSDYRGKVVVVDVWATWCEPCREQMPYMQKLEEELRGENIVFITLCLGAKVERETWLRILEQDQMNGVQVFGDGWRGQFVKDYRVTGVPRFMVFDEDGCIVTVNAPRPSSPMLKNLIKTLLEK